MNNDVWVILTTALLPALIAVVNRPHWSDCEKAIVSVLALVGFSVFWVWYNGQYDAAHIAQTIKTIITVFAGFYIAVYKPTGAKTFLEEKVNAGS